MVAEYILYFLIWGLVALFVFPMAFIDSNDPLTFGKFNLKKYNFTTFGLVTVLLLSAPISVVFFAGLVLYTFWIKLAIKGENK